jgi:hypothetical protein
VIGAVASFADIPRAVTDLAERRTTGRTIVLVDDATDQR